MCFFLGGTKWLWYQAGKRNLPYRYPHQCLQEQTLDISFHVQTHKHTHKYTYAYTCIHTQDTFVTNYHKAIVLRCQAIVHRTDGLVCSSPSKSKQSQGRDDREMVLRCHSLTLMEYFLKKISAPLCKLFAMFVSHTGVFHLENEVVKR